MEDAYGFSNSTQLQHFSFRKRITWIPSIGHCPLPPSLNSPDFSSFGPHKIEIHRRLIVLNVGSQYTGTYLHNNSDKMVWTNKASLHLCKQTLVRAHYHAALRMWWCMVAFVPNCRQCLHTIRLLSIRRKLNECGAKLAPVFIKKICV